MVERMPGRLHHPSLIVVVVLALVAVVALASGAVFLGSSLAGISCGAARLIVR
jgi:hypothetical protein